MAIERALAVVTAGMVWGTATVFAAAPAGSPSPALGDAAVKSPAQSGALKTAPAKGPAGLRPDREAAAIAFAREHHPELAALIEKLRTDNRRQYDTAVRQLAQASDRLIRMKKQSPAQYEFALVGWKLDSRAQLLAARMTLSQDPALEAELKSVLRERVDVRLKELEFERDQVENRWTRLDAAIREIERDKNAAADRDLQRIKRSVARSRRPPAKKPAIAQSKSTETKSAALHPNAANSTTAASKSSAAPGPAGNAVAKPVP